MAFRRADSLKFIFTLLCVFASVVASYGQGVSTGIGWCPVCGKDVQIAGHEHFSGGSSSGSSGGSYGGGSRGLGLLNQVGQAVGRALRGGGARRQPMGSGTSREQLQFEQAARDFERQAKEIPRNRRNGVFGIQSSPENPALYQRERITNARGATATEKANAALAHGTKAARARTIESAKEQAGLGFDTAGRKAVGVSGAVDASKFTDLRRRLNDRSKDLVMYQKELPRSVKLPVKVEQTRRELVDRRETYVKEYKATAEKYDRLRKEDPVKAAKMSKEYERTKGNVWSTEIQIRNVVEPYVKKNPDLAKPVGQITES